MCVFDFSDMRKHLSLRTRVKKTKVKPTLGGHLRSTVMRQGHGHGLGDTNFWNIGDRHGIIYIHIYLVR